MKTTVGKMISLKRKIFKLFTYFLLFVYLFVSMVIFMVDVKQRPDEVSVIRTLEREETQSRSYSSCANYRDYLKLLLETINAEDRVKNDSKSNCKILLNEDVVHRAMKYGLSSSRSTRLQDSKQSNRSTKVAGSTGDCRPLGYSRVKLPMTALASFPGSGNTWVRHLLQQSTGRSDWNQAP